jgi:hypothetical protein
MPTESEQSKPSGWLRRLDLTPPGGLFRGKITGRLDFERQFEAEFGKPLAKHIGRIIYWACLYPGEKIKAAEELAEQCRWELAAGNSVDQLIERLKVKPTRKTIRKRYVSQRGWLGRNFQLLSVLLCMLPLLWIASNTIYYYNSHPTLTVNYLAKINEPALAVPEQDRAWPGYREVILTLRADGEALSWLDAYGLSPGYPLWPERVALIERHSETLALLRETAMKPGLGLSVGLYDCYQGDDRIALYYTRDMGPVEPEMDQAKDWRDIDQGLLNKVMLPHLGALRGLTRLLVSDAYIAVEQGDADRFCQDIAAISNMAHHAAEVRFSISGLVGINTRSLAYGVLTDVLITDTDFLEQEHLVFLRRILDQDSQDQLVGFEGEKFSGLDFIQRGYTDDGRGGGHITPEFFQMLEADSGKKMLVENVTAQRFLSALYLPSGQYDWPSKQWLSDLHEMIYRQCDIELATPMWKQFESYFDDELELILDEANENSRTMSYIFTPSIGANRVAIARSVGARDGLRTGIALELYRRDYGDWPDALGDLIPTYLTEIPTDPITGGLALYKIIEDRPVVYSVGVDLDDDGSRLPINKESGEEDALLAATWWADDYRGSDGDWVLYPQLPTLRQAGAAVTVPEEGELPYWEGFDDSLYGGSYGDHKDAGPSDP